MKLREEVREDGIQAGSVEFQGDAIHWCRHGKDHWKMEISNEHEARRVGPHNPWLHHLT